MTEAAQLSLTQGLDEGALTLPFDSHDLAEQAADPWRRRGVKVKIERWSRIGYVVLEDS